MVYSEGGIACPVQICTQIGLKMEAGDCPSLNMNAMHNYLLSHSLRGVLSESDRQNLSSSELLQKHLIQSRFILGIQNEYIRFCVYDNASQY